MRVSANFAADGGIVAQRFMHRPRSRVAESRYDVALDGEGDGIVIIGGRPHLIWGRVVADIPDFCRELVAAVVGE